jgi:type I restriction enzyme S subunit
MKLSEGFQLLATAPEGVARLRELILSLAVQGKLVPQDPSDEPVSELLKRIQAEKNRLMADAGMRTTAQLEVPEEEKYVGEVPGWQYYRLGNLARFIDYRGRTPRKVEVGIPLITAKNVRFGFVSREPREYIAEKDYPAWMTRGFPRVGDLLFTTEAPLGNVALIDITERFALAQRVICFQLHDLSVGPYLRLAIMSAQVQEQLSAAASGMTATGIKASRLKEVPIAIPPLAEQLRIVKTVDELIGLCDELEVRGRLEAEQHTRLTATLFDALAASESPHALAENWSRIATHFDLLLDRPEAVDALEQIILQLAVRGLLVPQESNDAPASVVLEEVRAARDRLFALGKISRSKTPSENGDEPPVAPRVGWEMVTFPDLCVIGGGATPSKSKAAYWDGKLPWVSPKDMKVEHISDAQDHVSELALEETRLPLVPERSLLIVVRGMILAHSFPVGTTQVEVTINQDMKSLTPLVPALVPYLALVCRGFKHEILKLVDRSTHGTCKLQSDKLFAFRFGLPPLAEQSRILARVEEMRHLCGNLRERLTARQTCQAHFAEALVGQAASAVALVAHTDDLAAAA